VTPLSKWTASHPAIEAERGWLFDDLDLDLGGVVTVVVAAVASTELGPQDGHQEASGAPSESGAARSPLWQLHHELQVAWFLQDSLDRKAWFAVASGSLNSSVTQQVHRISSPIGLYGRIAFRGEPLLAKVRVDDKSIQGRDICGGTLRACESRHRDLRASIEFTVVARSI
jgi:hypothetical protein